MKEDIKSKLTQSLRQSIVQEKDVVYILIQIGKLLNLTDLEDEYRSLYFYRNWVAHEKITRQTQFVRELSKRFEKIHDNPISTRGVIFFAGGQELELELLKFTKKEIGFLLDRKFLNSFMDSLMQVVADVPITLELKTDKKIILSFDPNGTLNIKGPDYSSSILLLRSS